jgi:hypothetical protein
MGVPFIDLGPGRGLGKRWSCDDLFQVLDSATCETAPEKKKTSRKIRLIDRPLYGKSRKEQVAIIMGSKTLQ